MKTIMIAILLLLSCSTVFAVTYEERVAEMKRQNAAEIKRRHELQLEERKIEVLGRLQQLSASEMIINNNNVNNNDTSSRAYTKNTQSN